MTAVDLLRRESRSFVGRMRLWTPARWAAQASASGTRADVVHHLAQCYADAAAGLEGRPTRPLPRLDSDLALPDQLAVTTDDLLRAGPSVEQARAAAAHLLLHRGQLLDEQVPPGLADAVGLSKVNKKGQKGREECCPPA